MASAHSQDNRGGFSDVDRAASFLSCSWLGWAGCLGEAFPFGAKCEGICSKDVESRAGSGASGGLGKSVADLLRSPTLQGQRALGLDKIGFTIRVPKKTLK